MSGRAFDDFEVQLLVSELMRQAECNQGRADRWQKHLVDRHPDNQDYRNMQLQYQRRADLLHDLARLLPVFAAQSSNEVTR